MCRHCPEAARPAWPYSIVIKHPKKQKNSSLIQFIGSFISMVFFLKKPEECFINNSMKEEKKRAAWHKDLVT